MTEAAPTFVRWLWVWITVGALVVVVVIGFLIGIVGSLESIDDNLFEADRAVAGAGADVRPLPTYVQSINQNLTQIDRALKPIQGQAGDILGSLRSINGRLGNVERSLVNTTGSLVNTSGLLVNTSGQLVNINGLLANTAGTLVTVSGSLVGTAGTLGTVSNTLVGTAGTLGRISTSLIDTTRNLVSIRQLAQRIDVTLKDAQRVDTLGTNAIWRRVRFINGGPFQRGGNDQDTSLAGPGENPNGLAPIKADAGNILGGLREVNKHLTSICRSTLLNPLPPNAC